MYKFTLRQHIFGMQRVNQKRVKNTQIIRKPKNTKINLIIYLSESATATKRSDDVVGNVNFINLHI